MKNNIFYASNKTLEDLEWDEIKKVWASFCLSNQGKQYVLNIDFAQSYNELEFRRDLISEIKQLRIITDLNLKDRENTDAIFSRIEMGGVVKAGDFYSLIKLLDLSVALYEFNASEYPNLKILKQKINPLFELKHLLEDTIDEEGNIKSSASSELFGLRKRKTEIKKEITGKLDKLLNNPQLSSFIQDTYHTTREGRYVVPVKSEFRIRIKGIMHGISASGQTVFIEPNFILTLNNRISEIDTEIEVEEYRILADLARSVSHEIADLKQNSFILTKADAWRAAAILSEKTDSTTWTIANETNGLFLKNARHPLMVLENVKVVPNTIDLSNKKIMIITGPNAGGKTVTLKTVGILILMSATGLHIPTDNNSKIPPFKRLFTLIGDKQSIENGLSSFSAQIENLTEILKSNSLDLVLMDELAAGTDPTQGGALAQAVLEKLAENAVTTLVTTHYSRLKALAVLDPRFVNASMGGGSATAPGYKLIKGSPGTSEGLKVASVFGLPHNIIVRAKEILGTVDNKTDELLQSLSELRHKLEQEKQKLKESQNQLEQERKNLEDLERKKRLEIIKIQREGYGKITDDIARLRRLIAHMENKLKNSKSRSEIKRIVISVDKTEKEVSKKTEKWFKKAELKDIKKGNKLKSKSLGQMVEILEVVSEKNIKVNLGNMLVTLNISDLYLPEKEDNTKKIKQKKSKTTISSDPSIYENKNNTENEETESNEPQIFDTTNTIDLRGKRIIEAESLLIKFIDNMILKNITYCKIIHGFGSGMLKKTIREQLKNNPSVYKFRSGSSGEGSDGVTIVYLI